MGASLAIGIATNKRLLWGHEERFPAARPNGRCRIRKRSVAIDNWRRRLLSQALRLLGRLPPEHVASFFSGRRPRSLNENGRSIDIPAWLKTTRNGRSFQSTATADHGPTTRS